MVFGACHHSEILYSLFLGTTFLVGFKFALKNKDKMIQILQCTLG